MKKWLVSLIAGAIAPLAFAPLEIYPLIFFSITILFYQWLNANKGQAFWHGALFGLGFFGFGVSWVYISLHYFGLLPIWLAVCLTALLVIVLSVFIGATGYLANTFFKDKTARIKCLCVYPALWLIFEWLRCNFVLGGLPWLALGYSQTNSILRYSAPIIGSYGLTLIVCIISGGLTLLTQPIVIKTRLRIVGLFALIIVSCSFSRLLVTYASGHRSYQAVLIQGNIKQSLKWEPSQVPTTLQTYFSMTQQVKHRSIIVWPETAVPLDPRALPNYFMTLKALLKQTDSNLLFGAPTFNEKRKEAYNTMVLIGQQHGQYHKRHLVPFAEYFPLKFITNPLLKILNMPMSDFTAGQKHQPTLMVDGLKIAPFICYEIAYPKLVDNQTLNKQIIVVISDDSWFGDSIALNQQLQMAQMRAIETERYVLACNNTGITAIIDPRGRIIKYAPPNTLTMIKANIHPQYHNTPIMSWGYWIAWCACLALLCCAFLPRNKK